jgi:hypothetical protein
MLSSIVIFKQKSSGLAEVKLCNTLPLFRYFLTELGKALRL